MSGFRGWPRSNAAGLFANGSWLCDCSPRLPASHFVVKKPSANKGRWFYTCQKDKKDPTRCKFYLWQEDAKPREEAALLNNSRTEPGRTLETTPSRPRKAPSPRPPPPRTPVVDSSAPSRKRNRAWFEDDNDEFELDDDFETELDRARTAAETPSKAPRTESHTVPRRRKLPWTKDNTGLPTPQTESRLQQGPFQTRFAAPGAPLFTPWKHSEPEGAFHTATPSSSSAVETPTPARFRDFDDDLVPDVLAFIHQEGIKLPRATEQGLTQVLSKHSLRTEAFKRGRDQARTSLKAREAKVTELQHRITTLEAELQAEQALVQNLRWAAANGAQSDM